MMNSGSIKYKGGATAAPRVATVGNGPTVPEQATSASSVPVEIDLRTTLDEHFNRWLSKAPKNKEYVTRILYTGAAIEDVRRRIAAVFSGLCPSGWSYHSTININSGEALMIFERNAA